MRSIIQAICGTHIPNHLKRDIFRHQTELMCSGVPMKPIPAHDLHITLCYLKPFPQEKLPKLLKELHAVDFSPLSFKVQNIGFWEPNILYAKLAPCDETLKINVQLTTALSRAGFRVPQKYDFTPHITIGRIASEDLERYDTLVVPTLKKKRFPITEFHLLTREAGIMTEITTVESIER